MCLTSQTSQVAYFHAAPRVYPICLLIILNSRAAYTQSHMAGGQQMHVSRCCPAPCRVAARDHVGVSIHCKRTDRRVQVPTTPSGSEDPVAESRDSGILVERHTHVSVSCSLLALCDLCFCRRMRREMGTLMRKVEDWAPYPSVRRSVIRSPPGRD